MEGRVARYKEAEYHRRNALGPATVEKARIPSNPTIGNKWILNNDDDAWQDTIKC